MSAPKLEARTTAFVGSSQRELRAARRLANSVAMVVIVFGDNLYSETFDRMAAMLHAYRTAQGIKHRGPRTRYGPKK